MKDGSNQAVVTFGIRCLVAIRCDTAIVSPGVSQTKPTLSLATSMFESIRVIGPSTNRLPAHRRRPATL
jgi:hypothetical protein